MTARPSTKSRPLPNRCPDGEVLDRIAEALETGNGLAERNVAALEGVARELGRIAPLAEGMSELNGRLTKLCTFVGNNRLKIMAAVIAIASTPGFLAPEVGSAIKAGIEAVSATG
jgi:hypothetical protein